MSNVKPLFKTIVNIINERNISYEDSYEALKFLAVMYGMEVFNKDPKELNENILEHIAQQYVQMLNKTNEERLSTIQE